MRLQGAVVVVTGASSGIGRETALALAAKGARLVLAARRAAELEETAFDCRGLGAECRTVQCDVSDREQVDALARAAVDAFGRIDAWVNNAGADILTGDGASLSVVEKLDRLISVDLRGTMLASWQAAEILGAQETGGVIINMSWDHVLSGMEGINPQMFAAVKGGILAFSKSLARSVGPRVRVNVVAPGWIETSFAASMNKSAHRAAAESSPLKRWGTPEDVAAAAVFLASPGAAFITGQTMLVGGGVVM